LSLELTTIRVAIVEDDEFLREGLCRLIDAAAGFRCRALFSTAEEAISGLKHDCVDVLLLDIGLPGIQGDDAVTVLRGAFPDLVILILTVYSERPKIFASICNGANGYLLKSTPPQQLLQAIRAAHSGGSPLSPEIARDIVNVFQKLGPLESPGDALTDQETQLIGLLSQGHSYEAAARQMHVSVNTVRNYIRSVYRKLHAHSRSEAVAQAIRQGLIG
jgi:DNA-binding NarL/FixJ family response regulator